MKLTVQTRSIFGKKLTSLRKQNLVPGVIYSKHLSTNIPVSVNEVALKKAYAYAGSSTALELEGDGVKQLVLFHDYHLDPVTDRFLHVDFLAVKADEVVEAEVHIVFEGEAPVVKLNQGQLQFIKHSIMVEALPVNLPHNIKVDISHIANVHDGVFVRDLHLGDKVKIIDDLDLPIVVAVALSQEEESTDISVTDSST